VEQNSREINFLTRPATQRNSILDAQESCMTTRTKGTLNTRHRDSRYTALDSIQVAKPAEVDDMVLSVWEQRNLRRSLALLRSSEAGRQNVAFSSIPRDNLREASRDSIQSQ